MECDELLCGRKFPLQLRGVVSKSNARPEILYRNEVWCPRENMVGSF